MKALAKLAPYLLMLALFLAFQYALYQFGRQAGKAACEASQAKATQKAEVKVKAKARTDIARATTTGQQREQARRAIDTRFDQLDREAADEKPDPVDSCVLPAERLRRWNAANFGGADPGAAPGEPDRGAAAPAAGEERPGAGPGSEPSGGGEGLPPVGSADVQPAGFH